MEEIKTTNDIVILVLRWIAYILIMALVFMCLWNWLIPVIFIGGKVITFWQAIGLVSLINVAKYS